MDTANKECPAKRLLMDICINSIGLLIFNLLLQTFKSESEVNILHFIKLVSSNRKSTFSFNILKASCNAAVSSTKQDTSKMKRGVRENVYQLLDYALDLVGFTRRTHLYLRPTTTDE